MVCILFGSFKHLVMDRMHPTVAKSAVFLTYLQLDAKSGGNSNYFCSNGHELLLITSVPITRISDYTSTRQPPLLCQ